MNFDSYNDGITACLAGTKSVDCAYIFYATDTADITKTILPSLTADTIHTVCDTTHGVLRTKSVICKSGNTSNLDLIITSRGGERLGVNTPEFSAGAVIYNIAIVTSGNVQEEDILLVSTELTDQPRVPAGTDVVVTVKVNV